MSIFSFGLGASIGTFISILFISQTSKFGLKIDLNIFTNIVIAFATVIATLIHFDSQKKQRQDRIWDTNKTILLDLAHALSETIDATKIEIANRYAYQDEQIPSKHHDWNSLKEKINYVINVYGPLINKDLLASLNHHKEIANEINLRVNQEDLDSASAYEEMLTEHVDLYQKLVVFISKLSGISAT